MLLPWTLSFNLFEYLWASPKRTPASNVSKFNTIGPSLQFELRHLHASTTTSDIIFHDVSKADLTASGTNLQTSYTIQTRYGRSFKPPSFEAHAQARRRSITLGESEDMPWKEEDVLGPDVEKRETLLEIAKMTNNAYVEPESPEWYPLGGTWNSTYPFGWEPDSDGFRGNVFATADNLTVVISIKGTSAGVFGGGPTAKKDKYNDNLLFSCCCAHVDWTWTEVCKCHRGGWRCEGDCVEASLIDDSLFYPIGTNLYNDLTFMYPEATIWSVGHSLGGSLASLVGVTFGVPVVTFEAPGEAMPAKRLHLPMPPAAQQITHVYHTADPIAMGTCNGILSACAIAGYAMESKCHLGKTILYDTVSNLSWAVDTRTHGIVPVIEQILSNPWQASEEVGREVPEALPETDCVECYSWEYI